MDFTNLKILCYHGVTNIASNGIENFSGKHIEEKIFYRQLDFLKKNCTVLSMDEVIELSMQKKIWPQNPVAVTFDDGFKNNASIAAPILDELDIPATFYICPGMIDGDQIFWVDKIEACINLTKEKSFKLDMNGEVKFLVESHQSKINAVQKIKNFCKSVSADQKNKIIADLINRTNINPDPSHAENYQIMNWDDVCSLNESNLFTIGGHSNNHEIFTNQNREEIYQDIKNSLEKLRSYLNQTIKHYSYPEGQMNHFDEYVIQQLKLFNIACCPSSIEGSNEPTVDLFHLRRYMVGFEELAFDEIFSKD